MAGCCWKGLPGEDVLLPPAAGICMRHPRSLSSLSCGSMARWEPSSGVRFSLACEPSAMVPFGAIGSVLGMVGPGHGILGSSFLRLYWWSSSGEAQAWDLQSKSPSKLHIPPANDQNTLASVARGGNLEKCQTFLITHKLLFKERLKNFLIAHKVLSKRLSEILFFFISLAIYLCVLFLILFFILFLLLNKSTGLQCLWNWMNFSFFGSLLLQVWRRKQHSQGLLHHISISQSLRAETDISEHGVGLWVFESIQSTENYFKL